MQALLILHDVVFCAAGVSYNGILFEISFIPHAGLNAEILIAGAAKPPLRQAKRRMLQSAQIIAKVAELVDALDLGSSAARRESSSLSFRTRQLL
jgi:hypothetical protein